jgi:RNA polymerase sigma-70 factor, ECF subfamily
VRDKLVELLPGLYRYLYRLCGESHLAEDLAQDAVVRAMRALDQLDSPAALRVWLFRIGSNVWRDHCRRSNLKKLYEEEVRDQSIQLPLAANDPEPIDIIDQREQVQWTDQAMMQLPERQRMVLTLVVCEELSQREIAEVLDISPDAVKANLSVARSSMRKMWQQRVQHDKLP